MVRIAKRDAGVGVTRPLGGLEMDDLVRFGAGEGGVYTSRAVQSTPYSLEVSELRSLSMASEVQRGPSVARTPILLAVVSLVRRSSFFDASTSRRVKVYGESSVDKAAEGVLGKRAAVGTCVNE